VRDGGCGERYFVARRALLFANTRGWPFAGNDLNNSRWASAETILNNQNVGGLTVKWQFTTQNDVSATPSVDATGGYVYFPDWSGNLYKLNAATGATVWTHKMTIMV
jgi:polyvinyl alcohol dehydrogenase (cytochrome)